MSADIFISHSSKDSKIARTICSALEARGLSCWLAVRDVGPGENFMDAIVQAIREAKVMVLIFSENANNSDEIKRELVLAGNAKLSVVPVRVEDVLPRGAFAYQFATRQWIDLFEDWENQLERLTTWISRIVAAPLPHREASKLKAGLEPQTSANHSIASGSVPARSGNNEVEEEVEPQSPDAHSVKNPMDWADQLETRKHSQKGEVAPLSTLEETISNFRTPLGSNEPKFQPWSLRPSRRLVVATMGAGGVAAAAAVFVHRQRQPDSLDPRPGVLPSASADKTQDVGGTPVTTALGAIGPKIGTALLIGNANYSDSADPLPSVSTDLKILADTLQGRGLDIKLVADAKNAAAMESAREEFLSNLQRNLIALFYFTGFGIQSAGQNFLIPTNAVIWGEPDLKRDGLSLEQLLDAMKAKSRIRLGIIDAARRNPFERRFRSFSAGLAPTSLPANTLLIYSASPGKVISSASESPTAEGSLFMRELVSAINTRNLSVQDAFAQTRSKVASASHDDQIPFVSTTLGAPFFLSSLSPRD